MNAFEYVAPAGIADALEALSGRDHSCALAGGTDLINRMKDYVSSPPRVVYIREIKDLSGIQVGDGLTIGANTRLAEILADPTIARDYPAIQQATLGVGTPQIRNMATVGGNLLQRPRCWYFRNGFGLLGGKKRGGAAVRDHHGPSSAPIPVPDEQGGHLVRLGDNRYHAIFLTDGDALFVAPSSLAPPLIALGAKAMLLGPKGERTVEVEDLYRVPRADGDRELTIEPGELLTKVTIPPGRGKNATHEVRWKQSHDWPLALASVCLELDGETVKQARIVLGAVAPIPWRSKEAEDAITGKPVNRETAAAAGAAAVQPAEPLSRNAYKVQLARVAVRRALLAAIGQPYWEA